jgi:hypothetical protein
MYVNIPVPEKVEKDLTSEVTAYQGGLISMEFVNYITTLYQLQELHASN